MLKLVLITILVAAALSVDAATLKPSRRHHKRHWREVTLLAGEGGSGEPPKPGGFSTIVITARNAERFTNLAQTALNTYKLPDNSDDNCNQNLLVDEVTSVKSQVVNGRNYQIEFTVRAPPSGVKSCNVKPPSVKCTAELNVPARGKTAQVNSITCTPPIDFSSPGKASGAFTKLKFPDTTEMRAIGQVALGTYKVTTKPDDVCNRNLLVDKVTSAETQPVPKTGQNLNLEFTVKPSATTGCNVDPNKPYTCSANVFVPTDPKKETKMREPIVCTPPIDFAKPPVVVVPPTPSWKTVKTNSSRLVNYAQAALNKFGCSQKTACTQNLVVDKIDKVDVLQQQDGGAIYKIVFSYRPQLAECLINGNSLPNCLVQVTVPSPGAKNADVNVLADKPKCDVPNFELMSNYKLILA